MVRGVVYGFVDIEKAMKTSAKGINTARVTISTLQPDPSVNTASGFCVNIYSTVGFKY